MAFNQNPQKKGVFSGLTELKHRLLFVLSGLIVYRIGAHIPIPGLDMSKLANFFNQHNGGILGLFNMFSGGALSRLTIFALGIMPYISASIIMQLLLAVLPNLEELKKEGESGRRKINEYTRYGTVILSLFQGIGVCKWLIVQQIALQSTMAFYITTTISLVAGTMIILWLGEQITERGVGNGVSLIIFSGIVSGLPSAIARFFEQLREGEIQFLSVIIVMLLVFAVVAFVVFMERSQRQIMIHYPQRMQGKKMYAAQNSHLPLKINMAGVIPPIFASSIILLPATLAQFFSNNASFRWISDIGLALEPGQPLYMLFYSAAIIFFSFFYTALVFNPKDTADNLKKSGAFIPGIRPGELSAKYIDNVMTRLTLIGSLYLVIVALLPEIMVLAWHVPFYFGGTSLLIIVVVVMDFIAQVHAHLMSRQYESLMKKTNLKGAQHSPLKFTR